MDMKGSRQRWPARRLVVGALVMTAVIAFAAFQFVQIGPGSRDAQPPSSVSAAPPLDPSLATGALAAFIMHDSPKELPNLSFTDGDGNPRELREWEGRVVLLNLWATWCAPCRVEMPMLNALEKQYGGEDFEVVALSVDRNGIDASAAFLKEIAATDLALYVDATTRSINELQARGLPATLLIGRDGRELGRLLGPAEWDGPEAVALIKAALEAGSAS